MNPQSPGKGVVTKTYWVHAASYLHLTNITSASGFSLTDEALEVQRGEVLLPRPHSKHLPACRPMLSPLNQPLHCHDMLLPHQIPTMMTYFLRSFVSFSQFCQFLTNFNFLPDADDEWLVMRGRHTSVCTHCFLSTSLSRFMVVSPYRLTGRRGKQLTRRQVASGIMVE